MKLYAQHGSQAGSKIDYGIEHGIIDGVIYSPRDIALVSLAEELKLISARDPRIDLLFDPEYYTCVLAGTNEVRLGHLPGEYTAYFGPRREVDLRKEATIKKDILNALKFQLQLPLTYLIAPNIVVSRSLDSREAAVAMDFVRLSTECKHEVGATKPMLATVAVSRDALLDRAQVEDFANELTALDDPPDGFYVLISTQSTEARTEIYNSDVIGAWLYLSYVLNLNGLKVVNGYSDILAPFLCCVGASAGATGWWSNLRSFSLERFEPTSRKGRLPIPRYLSTMLLNRITFRELDLLKTLVPRVLNGLESDGLYDGEGSEPARSEEVFQSWEAISELGRQLEGPKLVGRLEKCERKIETAQLCYDEAKAGMSLDAKSNDEHLDALAEGIALFKKFAELGSPK